MTLATRCPACATVFRVVQDQLRVSQGWVRCGRCSEAFNALESMVDLPAGRGPEAAPSPSTAPSSWAPQTDPQSTESLLTPEAPETTQAPAAAVAVTRDGHDVAVAAPEPPATAFIELPPGMEVIASDGALSADVVIAETAFHRTVPFYGFEPPPEPAVPAAVPAVHAVHAAPAEPVAALEAPPPAAVAAQEVEPETTDAAQAPSFLVEAARAERWRRPGVRVALAVAAGMAALGLAAQASYAFRDRLAVSLPTLRPLLQQACATLGCRVGDYRQIDALSVESSGLTRVEGAPVYRLAVTLRNRAEVEVAAPALDLALTDAQGQQIARRVLRMSDLNLPLRTLKAGSELPIQVPLGIGDRQVSGYTVEIFYP